MNTVSKFLNLALGQEDSFGKILGGSSGKGMRTMWKDAGANGLKGTAKFSKFVDLADQHVKEFDKAMNLASDVFNKKTLGKDTLKALKKESKTNKAFAQKIVELYKQASSKTLTPESLKKIFGNTISSKADDIAASAVKSLEKTATETTGKGIGKLFKSLKGKGGTLGIIFTVAFELPELIKAFKNGDGLQQIGRSSFNIAGFAGGAAAGAAIGSVIPVAGTAVGAIVGGLCGLVGGMAGGAVTSKIAESIFGKSIADKKEELAQKQQKSLAQQQQLAQSYNPNMFNTYG